MTAAYRSALMYKRIAKADWVNAVVEDNVLRVTAKVIKRWFEDGFCKCDLFWTYMYEYDIFHFHFIADWVLDF